MRDKITLPTCMGCPAHLVFSERYAVKQNGVLMKPGERYCLGKKKAVRFSAKDPKVYPPSWCPKRKSPCEVRVYGFKSARDWYLHETMCRELGKELPPEVHRYCLEQEGTTELTPKRFWDSLKEKHISDLLPFPVFNHNVIEIDDGLKPICFFKTESGMKTVSYFDTARAKANKKEDDD